MNGLLLITRPECDPATRYLSRWSMEIIEKAKDKKLDVIDLLRNKAERKRLIGTLKKTNPRLVCLNGHGGEDLVRGHENKIILKSGDEVNINCKIIFVRACKSAKILGTKIISGKTLAFLGYKDDFCLKLHLRQISDPIRDKTAALYLKPSNHIVISILKGHSVGYANEKSKKLSRKNIEKLLVKGHLAEDYDCISSLYWNMINQVCLGDKNATL